MRSIQTALICLILLVACVLQACQSDHNDPVLDDSTPDSPAAGGDTPNDSTDGTSSRSLILDTMPDDFTLADSQTVEGDAITRVLKVGNTDAASDDSVYGDDYALPTVIRQDDGSMALMINDAPLPSMSSRQELEPGEGGRITRIGDRVQFRFDMFSWSTGELVASTHQMALRGDVSTAPVTPNPEGTDSALVITLGDRVDGTQVPLVLHNALLNRREKAKLQVVFERRMNDLPSLYDSNDAYVLIVDIEKIL